MGTRKQTTKGNGKISKNDDKGKGDGGVEVQREGCEEYEDNRVEKEQGIISPIKKELI